MSGKPDIKQQVIPHTGPGRVEKKGNSHNRVGRPRTADPQEKDKKGKGGNVRNRRCWGVGYLLMNFQMVSAMSVASLLAVFISGKPRYWASSKPVTRASTWKP